MRTIQKIFLFITALLITRAAMCQNDSLYQFMSARDYPVVYFTTSPSGELFTINANNQLKKYDSNGDSVGVFNDVKKYGKLSYVVAQNPWQTVLYYEDFETVLLLDKYLKVLGSINLRDKNIFGVKAVSSSYDNNLWIFDPTEMKIRKLDENGKQLLASVDLRQVFSEVPSPVRIIDRDGLLYLYDSSKGVYVFDYYGSFKTLLPFRNWESIFVFGKTIYGFDDLFIYSASSSVPVEEKKPLPAFMTNADQISISPQKIWVLKNKILSTYLVPK